MAEISRVFAQIEAPQDQPLYNLQIVLANFIVLERSVEPDMETRVTVVRL
jgi:hypothetical protein